MFIQPVPDPQPTAEPVGFKTGRGWLTWGFAAIEALRPGALWASDSEDALPDFVRLAGWMVLLARASASKDAELLALPSTSNGARLHPQRGQQVVPARQERVERGLPIEPVCRSTAGSLGGRPSTRIPPSVNPRRGHPPW